MIIEHHIATFWFTATGNVLQKNPSFNFKCPSPVEETVGKYCWSNEKPVDAPNNKYSQISIDTMVFA